MKLQYQDFQITKHFHTSEFHCKDGTRVPHEYIPNVVYVALQLERLRYYLGNITIHINSAYRSEKYNADVAGSRTSNHLTANAVDIRQQKYSNKEFYEKIKNSINNGVIPAGELIYYNNFVHYAPNYHESFNGLQINDQQF